MRTITLRIEPSPTSNDHQVRIQIDGHDWFGENYLGIDPPRFFSQSTLTTGGSAIVGRCECGTVGCDDRIADIVIESDEVTWNINKEYTLHFDKATYLTAINSAANDFSWEDKRRTAERLVEEVFRDIKLKDDFCFSWASARIKQGKVALSFSRGTSQRILYFDWIDENPETAVATAKQFKTELLQ